MSIFLTDPKQLERKEDKEIAKYFLQSIDKELKNKKEKDVVPELIKLVKDIFKDHPYLVGILIGIIIAKYSNIEKELDL